jgi:hypothetical protein
MNKKAKYKTSIPIPGVDVYFFAKEKRPFSFVIVSIQSHIEREQQKRSHQIAETKNQKTEQFSSISK